MAAGANIELMTLAGRPGMSLPAPLLGPALWIADVAHCRPATALPRTA